MSQLFIEIKSVKCSNNKLEVEMSGITMLFSWLESHYSLILLQQYFFHEKSIVLFSNLEDQVVFFVKEFQSLQREIVVFVHRHLYFTNWFVGQRVFGH